ncbi:MAG: hypothetical protein ACXVQ5_07130 [Actinomycetota bacterium]
MRKIVAIALLGMLGAAAGCSSASSPSAASPSPSEEVSVLQVPTLPQPVPSVKPAAPKATKLPSACRGGNPLANVYHPDRLLLIAACKTVDGVIETIRHESDGDYHFDLKLDSPFANLVNSGNVRNQHGWLVAEIVPADEPGCLPGQPPKPVSGTYNYGYCTGADITTPPIGTHVAITGPYVLDQAHGWMEIHPVWRIVRLSGTVSNSGPATSLKIVSVTSPAYRGSNATLVAQTSARAGCNLSVTLPSGAQSQSTGLGSATADSSGRVQWTWKIGTRTTPGTATAVVSCGSHTASKTFTIR